jgi:hypothetical protein
MTHSKSALARSGWKGSSDPPRRRSVLTTMRLGSLIRGDVRWSGRCYELVGNQGGAVNESAEGRSSKFSAWASRAKQYQERARQAREKLEQKHSWIAFPLEANRRFSKIEGKHLAIVIALNLFVAIIPLIIIGYAFIEAFNPHRDVGNLFVSDLT